MIPYLDEKSKFANFIIPNIPDDIEFYCAVYDIIDNLKLKDVKDIYDKYYDFSTYYISNDKKEFK